MPGAQELELIAALQDITHDCLKMFVRPDEPIAILDFPDIKNCGDSAIWLGEIAYLKDRYAKRPSYVCTTDDFSHDELKGMAPSGPIFIHGGGNFGDLWVSHQDFREHIMELFPDRQIVQFPQSIHYSSPERLEQSRRAIGRHKNFVLLVRDEESLLFAQEKLDCQVHLCPDMAFCIGSVQPDAPRFPVLAMLRQDKEQVGAVDFSAYPHIPREDWITERHSRVRVAKALGAASALLHLSPSEVRLRKLNAAANNRFRRGIRQISRGKAILTDRLHVHICSILIARPHAVLDNNYGKIRRFMNAFSGGTDLSYKAMSIDDGIRWAREQAVGTVNDWRLS
ncbi:polysaccharide pyruvyl transferase family protein [Mesorhizobium sp. B283B1A]|uniref:polysaccharide pyruvyl transferase family protein n=1 Tax=Mesorhizobium TaxID=68287 RepID=UPI001CD16941|nr:MULTISPECIES: polysaccharide pyruvyl transferase family protein [Mesorhizobium]MCA0049281.1 polysaccharide pyruvyl transferase family protein [Mesorhizobium sp. B283B1A]UQS64432.1 polysaccharide pyruvyl transferase family protein [Mesorhizobium opportunistum]